MLKILALIFIAATPFAVATLIFQLHSDLIWLLTVPIGLAILLCARRGRVPSWALCFFAASCAFATFGLVFIYFYYQVTLINFSSQLALESLHDSTKTVATSFTREYVLRRVWLGLTLALTVAVGGAIAFRRFERLFDNRLMTSRERRLLTAVLVTIGLTYAHSGWRAMEGYRISDHLNAMRRSSAGDLPPLRTGDSVFVLQLESFNATSVFARAGEGVRQITPLPELMRIWREGNGTLFPFFWANTSATNRALESIACGISGNMSDNSRAVEAPAWLNRCLPNDLRRAGYQTRVFHSTLDTHFHSWDHVLPLMGFGDARAGDRVVGAGSPRWAFGYDDCSFYDGVAQALKTEPKVPNFTYFAVCMNHAPFDGTRRHPETWAYPNPKTPRELYVNSLREQDHCLANFWKMVQAYGREHLHVFIVGDHSVPLLQTIELEDRFFTSLLYLPPLGRAARPRTIVSGQPPSQADLYPTIIDLLYDRPSPRSFAATLNGGAYEPKDRCSTSLNMHGLIAYTRADRRAYYSFDGDRSEVLDRAEDGSWVARPAPRNFLEFERTYGCP